MLASRSGRFPRRPDFSSRFMVMSLLRSSLASNFRSRMAACSLISAWVRRGLRSGVGVTAVPPFPSAMSLILLFVLSMSTLPGIPVFSSGFFSLHSAFAELGFAVVLALAAEGLAWLYRSVRRCGPVFGASFYDCLGLGRFGHLGKHVAGLLRPVQHFLERQFGCPGFADVFPVASSAWILRGLSRRWS